MLTPAIRISPSPDFRTRYFLSHWLKRGFAAFALAAAFSMLAPAATSFFVFSLDFRPHTPDPGGTLLVYKNGQIPAWMIEATTQSSSDVPR
jgi:hypothetical protein